VREAAIQIGMETNIMDTRRRMAGRQPERQR